MAYNPFEELKNGRFEFLANMSTSDINNTINYIRNSSQRLDIINGFLSKLIGVNPYFCFKIIYDIPEYDYLPYTLLFKDIELKYVTLDMFKNILNTSRYRDTLISEHLDEIAALGDDYAVATIKYIIRNRDTLKELFHRLSRTKNLHLRYLFMRELILENINLVREVYEDICDYFTEYNYEEYEQLSIIPELMDVNDVCDIAMLFLKNNHIKEFRRIKEYVLSNYKSNKLAYLLDSKLSIIFGDPDEVIRDKKSYYNLRKKELFHDLDRLFATSSTYKIHLYQDYHGRLSKKILEDFEERIKYFRGEANVPFHIISNGSEGSRAIRLLYGDNKDFGNNICNVYYHGLGDILDGFVDKYLALSRRDDYEFIGKGSTCATYRIGDYAFKLFMTKWSYEDVICPNLYLIVRNLEEIYLRDRRGIVTAGIEVQPFLSRSVSNVPKEYFELYKKELDRLGYYVADTLVNGSGGDNTRLLDSYQDACTNNLEGLPEWFKEYPIVLVDRDRVYKKGRNIRQRVNFFE